MTKTEGKTKNEELKHYPVRTETYLHLPTHYVALCGYESDNPAEFCRPETPEKTTCTKCREYERQKVK